MSDDKRDVEAIVAHRIFRGKVSSIVFLLLCTIIFSFHFLIKPKDN